VSWSTVGLFAVAGLFGLGAFACLLLDMAGPAPDPEVQGPAAEVPGEVLTVRVPRHRRVEVPGPRVRDEGPMWAPARWVPPSRLPGDGARLDGSITVEHRGGRMRVVATCAVPQPAREAVMVG
jgi:hypothetical protein